MTETSGAPRAPATLLAGMHVLDLSSGISGGYATKLLSDAGADVVKVEPATGDPLRRSVPLGVDRGTEDGALFEYLAAGKRSVHGDVSAPEVAELLSQADVVVESGQLSDNDIDRVIEHSPSLSVVSVTPFGRTGPWSGRPTTEFTLQALCGSIAGRGSSDREPLQAGGRIGEWIAGIYTAIAALAVFRESRRCGLGDHVDVAIFDAMCATMSATGGPINATLNPGPRLVPPRVLEIPSVVPTSDGYVGFCTITAQQFSDFLLLIERPDLQGDADLATFRGRQRRSEEFFDAIHAWSKSRTTAEIVELATLYRVPVAPVGEPETIPDIDHFAERGVYATAPCGRFAQPRVSYQLDGAAFGPSSPAPRLGADEGAIDWGTRARPGGAARRLPLDGVRIIDATAFWAGPSSTYSLALLGADVIHVESIQRPDGMRFTFTGNPPSLAEWWEASPAYQTSNLNKRAITLNLDSADGRELFFELVAQSDAIVENYSPRVFAHFGITWEDIHARNPRAVMVRMPAFGLSGPWSDRTGFAQTMEQAVGMAWMTGFADGAPTVPRGPCDPIAGTHATFALLAALHDRDQSGAGHFVESTMIESAANVAAEIVVTHGAYGLVLERDGNRGPYAAPQGVYACRGTEEWVALAVESDEHWAALRGALRDPAWADDDRLDTAEGRRDHHDLVDDHIRVWMEGRGAAATAELLSSLGVPAERVGESVDLGENPQLRYRGTIESIESPLIGRHEVLSLPFQFRSRSTGWVTRHSPTLGEHNHEVLGELLGRGPDDLERLEMERVIGTVPLGL